MATEPGPRNEDPQHNNPVETPDTDAPPVERERENDDDRAVSDEELDRVSGGMF